MMDILKCAVKFKRGNKVSFEHRDKTIRGEVVKISQKTISIKSECDVCRGKPNYWNVDSRLIKTNSLQAESKSVKI